MKKTESDSEEKKVVKKTKRVAKKEIKEETKDERIVKPKKRIVRKKTSEPKEKKETKNDEKEVEEVIEVQRGANFSLIEVIVIILITGIVVSVCSGLIVYNNYDKFVTKTETNNSVLSELIKSYNHIVDSYVDKVDEKGLIDAAIKGMYDFLGDQYSVYMDEETTKSLTEQLTGEYEGIGIEITMNEKNEVVISRVFSDTPAEKAGLKAGDIITKIDNESMVGKTSSDVANTIRYGKNNEYEVTYKRNDEEKKVKIERKRVFIDSVSYEVKNGIGYISLDTFSATTADQVKKAIDSFDDSVKSLIIDVRYNTGGYLSAAYDVSELFVEKGKVIYQLKDRNNKITKKYANDSIYRKFDKIVVLINEGSASASEILACALKESAGATIVGKNSFGKGTVQETDGLKSGAMVKYTTAYWLSPEGNSINEIGLKPDIEVAENLDTTDDEQLNKALETAK